MGIGYLLGAIAAFTYAGLVGYFGGIKRKQGILKMVKAKLGKKIVIKQQQIGVSE